MPLNEIEQHPYVQIGEAIRSNRMIVGTFPIYPLTNPRTERKNKLQEERGDISFFYGSNSNQFWSWYQRFVDQTLVTLQPVAIINSLQRHSISISDVVKESSRIRESFKDNDLRNKQWNLSLATTIEQSIDKIICTSKSDSGAAGWLRDKILKPEGFVVNQNQTVSLHRQILDAIPRSYIRIKPIAHVLTKGARRISIVALPSPGSPERRLINFGYIRGSQDTTTYLTAYLTQAFSWFTH